MLVLVGVAIRNMRVHVFVRVATVGGTMEVFIGVGVPAVEADFDVQSWCLPNTKLQSDEYPKQSGSPTRRNFIHGT